MQMRPKRNRFISVILLVGLIIFAGSVGSEMDCAKVSHWSQTDPPVNQQHVFCGEWNQSKNRPAGFHSRPAGENPATIGTLKITQKPDPKGLYGVRWSYTGHPASEKFSSLFPDACSRDQVLKSIAYAAKHSKRCPAGAPRWAKCGPSKPPGQKPGFCRASDDSVFIIAFATLKNSNKVNTAFPLVEWSIGVWVLKIGEVSGVSVQRRRRPKRRPVKSNRILMNIEHRTSNIERRIMYSVNF